MGMVPICSTCLPSSPDDSSGAAAQWITRDSGVVRAPEGWRGPAELGEGLKGSMPMFVLLVARGEGPLGSELGQAELR
jgi:hypothetical protein